MRRLCDDLTPRTARELARGLKARSCEAAFTLVLGTAQTTYSVTQTLIAMPTVLLVDVRRHDDIATAELRSKSKADGIARFSFVGGHWRLDAPAPRGQYSRDCKSDACSTVATLSFIYGGR